ncbi:hypothetical protein [Streptomyces sp. NPDC093269]|uniref:hypothetical protein n=1 Tax=Streptomyces sp. NPDC093269 TaxID=3366038 RepID=UPI0037F9F298
MNDQTPKLDLDEIEARAAHLHEYGDPTDTGTAGWEELAGTDVPALVAEVRRLRAATEEPTVPVDDESAELREPNNPAAYALARHIADHPMSTIYAAFRYLNAPLTVEFHEDPATSDVAGEEQPATETPNNGWHPTPETLDLFVRALVNHVDYDIHKGYECGEEDGEDHYPELVEKAAEILDAITREQPAVVARQDGADR